MRVLHALTTLERHGAGTLVTEHVLHAGAGVESFVCALSGELLDGVHARGPSLPALDPAGRRRFDGGLGAALRLATWMRQERITVAHVHDPAAVAIVTLAAVRAHVPVVFRTEHEPHHPGRGGSMYPMLESLATHATGRVICTCEAVRRSHAVRLPWAADRFVTVPPGVSIPHAVRGRGVTRAALGLLDTDRMVLAVCGLTALHAPHVLIEAFHRVSRRMSGARLVLAGEGPRRADLERQVEDAGLADRVSFLGERADVADLMEAADVFALATVRAGVPVALLEAMRAGCPSVVAGVGGVPEVVADGETGWIVPPHDPAATADALLNLLVDRARARSFAAAARDRWTRAFTAERMVSDTERWYRAELARVRAVTARRARAEAAALGDIPEGMR